jgi:hypothetical protein
MKNQSILKLVLLVCSCLFSFTRVFATIFTVDNNASSASSYTTITAAHDAAQAGDTLYIQPSGTNYVNSSISKKLFIIGPGHTPSYTPGRVKLAGLTITASASGSMVEGLIFATNSLTLAAGTIDVTVRNCLFQGNTNLIAQANCHNLVFTGNVFDGYAGNVGCLWLNTSSQNVLIQNNYFRLLAGSSVHVMLSANVSTIFNHNTVIVAAGTGAYCQTCNAHQVSNNIWIGTTQNISSGAAASVFFNNQTYSAETTFDNLPGTGNLNNVEPVFVNAQAPYVWSVSSDFNLAESNAGRTGAADGGQTGIFGAGYNFRNRGEPKGIPTFDQVILYNYSVAKDGNIQMRVKAKKGLN